MPGGLDLDFDSYTLAGEYDAGWKPVEGGQRCVIGFGVASREQVDALFAEMTGHGYPGPQPPYDTFWGARYAIVEDPDGNHVGIMSPIDPKRRSAPPASIR